MCVWQDMRISTLSVIDHVSLTKWYLADWWKLNSKNNISENHKAFLIADLLLATEIFRLKNKNQKKNKQTKKQKQTELSQTLWYL